MDIMMQLGSIVFSLPKTCYDTLSQSNEYRHVPQALLNRPPAYQFMGEGEEHKTLSGTLYTTLQNDAKDPTTAWKEAFAKGNPLPLYDGQGNKLGNFRILKLDTQAGGEAGFLIKGIPRTRQFTLELVKDNA